jgi:hypothetical protein
VIRRAFWLTVGAAAGITGYRRVTALGRAISVRTAAIRDPAAARFPNGPVNGPASGSADGRKAAGGGRSAPGLPGPYAQSGPGARVAYRAARPQPVRWSATRTAWRTSRAAWRAQKLALARIRAAGLFARDVREGMDMYMNRQQGHPGPTLADTTSNRGPRARPH